MPRKPIDYSKTIMYKIVHNDLTITDIYIGHTTDFTKRKWGHKKCCNNEKNKKYNMKIYQMIREKGGWDNWSMFLIEEFPCKNSLQARKRERELYEQYHANLNTLRPYRSEQEYKQYYEANREKLLEKKKQYYEANREQIQERKKQYHEANKEQINEKHKQKSNCPFCNKEMRKNSIPRHIKICKNNITI